MRFELMIKRQEKFRFRFLGRVASWTILEFHETGCTCSYCREDLSGIGYTSPESAAPNAWRRFHLKTKSGMWCLRSTLPKGLCKKTGNEERVADRLMGRRIRKWK